MCTDTDKLKTKYCLAMKLTLMYSSRARLILTILWEVTPQTLTNYVSSIYSIQSHSSSQSLLLHHIRIFLFSPNLLTNPQIQVSPSLLSLRWELLQQERQSQSQSANLGCSGSLWVTQVQRVSLCPYDFGLFLYGSLYFIPLFLICEVSICLLESHARPLSSIKCLPGADTCV